MKTHQSAGRALICLAIIITLATLAVAGCTESAAEQQGQMPVAREKQIEKPVAKTTVTMRTTDAPVQMASLQPAPDPVLPGAVITFDPIGDRKTGDRFTITGTTSLPEGTNLFWEIRKDTGTPPTGIDMNTQMGILANNQVTKGSSTSNRVSLDADMKDILPGKYVVVVVSLKGDPMTVDPTTGTRAGYTYLTLK